MCSGPGVKEVTAVSLYDAVSAANASKLAGPGAGQAPAVSNVGPAGTSFNGK